MANILKIPSRISGAGFTNPKIIAGSGYYSPPKDCLIKVHLYGGGGGGAAGSPQGGTQGGAGGYVFKTLRVKGAAVYNVTVGAGGSGAPSAGSPGGTGGTTSFLGLDIDPLYAYGGAGGQDVQSPGSMAYTIYGRGGLGFGGDYMAQGQSGAQSGGAYVNYGGPVPGSGNPSVPSARRYVDYINYAFYIQTTYGSGGAAGSFISVPNPWNPNYPGYYGSGTAGIAGIVYIEELL